jgi:hypothetical protein
MQSKKESKTQKRIKEVMLAFIHIKVHFATNLAVCSAEEAKKR